MPTATRLEGTYLGQWPEGSRHYQTSDGRFFIVEVDAGELADSLSRGAPSRMQLFKPRPTVIIEVDAEGNAASLDRLHTFEPGTSHEDALAQAGYETAA